MERSAHTLSPRKFSRMQSARQHDILAELTDLYLDGDIDKDCFTKQYAALNAVAELDVYIPPHWLDAREALIDRRAFHQALNGKPESLPEARALTWRPTVPVDVVVDAVRAPYNAGAILRLMDNFGFRRLIHRGPFPSLEHPRLVRAARGCQHWIPTQEVEDLPGWLAARNQVLVGIEDDPRAQDLQDWVPRPNSVLILGNETYGIARAVRDLCHELVRIPMHGFKKSMNVSHAFAVVGQRMVEKLSPSCQDAPNTGG